MVSATTMDSITWTWNAVEGALGYAVQVSHDEMFDDTDMTHPTTETTFTASDLEPETSVFVRVRAAAGTVEAPLVSAWTTHVTGMSAMPPPPPPAPMAAPTPTGLTSEPGDGSITWSWEAVEGADGYAVQVSMDEMFDDMDETHYITETSHMVEDLGYSETRFARVASTSGEGDDMLMSMWTTHVTGMSNAAPPLPPPSASFSLPDGQSHFMVADDDDDEETAMAWLNPKTMVDSDSTAIITPMWMEGASGVSVDAASDNMPFTHVGAEDNWELLQSAVLDGGATFMVQRARLGANQEMEPTNNDVSYITCGPFECQEGMDPPMISIANSAACTAWDPMVEIQVGKVDNDVVPTGEDADTRTDVNDGIDLGIVTSSSLPIKVKHVFSGVANGRNTSISVDAAKGSDKVLAMKGGADGYITVNAATDDDATVGVNEAMVCDNGYDEGDLTDRPGSTANCFRLRGPGAGRDDNDTSKGPDYLSGWSIEMTPDGGAVTWGMVEWEEDPFEDLTCGAADPIMVADHVDVCAMFDAEVDLATGKGWKPTVVFDGTNQVTMWKATASPATGTKMFETIWFDDNLNGKILKDASPPRGRPMTDGDGDGSAVEAGSLHDLRNDAGRDSNINAIWQYLTDLDGDLTAGDLGKADLVSDVDDPKTADNETTPVLETCTGGGTWTAADYEAGNPSAACVGGTYNETGDSLGIKTNPDGKADNYEMGNNAFSDFRACGEGDGGDDADGSECDAEWMHDVTVLFADGTFGCTTTRDVTVTCMWDADGGMAQGRNALPSEFIATGTDSNLPHFLKCSAK